MRRMKFFWAALVGVLLATPSATALAANDLPSFFSHYDRNGRAVIKDTNFSLGNIRTLISNYPAIVIRSNIPRGENAGTAVFIEQNDKYHVQISGGVIRINAPTVGLYAVAIHSCRKNKIYALDWTGNPTPSREIFESRLRTNHSGTARLSSSFGDTREKQVIIDVDNNGAEDEIIIAALSYDALDSSLRSIIDGIVGNFTNQASLMMEISKFFSSNEFERNLIVARSSANSICSGSNGSLSRTALCGNLIDALTAFEIANKNLSAFCSR